MKESDIMLLMVCLLWLSGVVCAVIYDGGIAAWGSLVILAMPISLAVFRRLSGEKEEWVTWK